MRRYSFDRSEAETTTFTRRKDGFVYVFRGGDGWWNVYKLEQADVEASIAAGLTERDVLSKVDPQYRVVEGSCSCPGFGYRRDCWHRDQVLER